MQTPIARDAGAVSNTGSQPHGAPPPLAVEHIAKSFFTADKITPVVGDLSFVLGKGEIVAIVGPSGCGKTTLLNVVCGLIPPDAGEVRWHGQKLGARGIRSANVGYMLQKDLLLPWRTAIANVKLGMEIRRVPKAEANDRARALLDQLGLNGFADNYPSTLSGGMRQRVALARTLVNDPDVLLLDEPFAALDFQTKLLIESDTVNLSRQRKVCPFDNPRHRGSGVDGRSRSGADPSSDQTQGGLRHPARCAFR